MAAVSTVIAGVGLAIGAAGTVAQVQAAGEQAEASKKAEAARQRAMNLDARRRQLATIREGIVARGTALSNASNQGSQFGSGLAGGMAQISGQTNTNLAGIEQNRQLGNQVFSANRQAASASSASAFGGGLASLGGTLVNNAQAIGRIGNYVFG